MHQINVLRPFRLLAFGREQQFTVGKHDIDNATAWHPWVQAFADGAIESPAQEAARLEREAAAARLAVHQEQRAESPKVAADESVIAAPVIVPPPAMVVQPAEAPGVEVALGGFDWKNPTRSLAVEDAKRASALARIRATPELLPDLFELYGADPASFICDWGVTTDPRNIEVGLPTEVPFVLFPRQVEFVNTIIEVWKGRENLIVEKTREIGASWIAIALACTLCLFREGMVIGFGSRKEELVDKLDDPKSLFWKARAFMSALPIEFQRGWDIDEHAPHMRIIFPATGSYITGEAGDNIGRGGRSSMFFVDEAAFLERPLLIDAALSRNTNCRVDISTPNGMANSFFQRRQSGNTKVFTFHWRHDPRKDQAWYEREKLKIDNPVVVAQELDISYSGSVDNVLIPSEWVQSIVGAAEKLGIEPSGYRIAGFDVADAGVDKNAVAGRHGIELVFLEEFSGKNSDIYASTVRVMGICDQNDFEWLEYDADGLGAGVKGDARIINEHRIAAGKPQIRVSPYCGSGSVVDPDKCMVEKRLNKELFLNRKSQAWWWLRLLCQNTDRALKGLPFDPAEIISISPRLPPSILAALCAELSQPTWSMNNLGKIMVDKQPEGTKSPNLADAVVIAYSPGSAARAMRAWLRLAGKEPK